MLRQSRKAGRKVQVDIAIQNIARCKDVAVLDALIVRMTSQAVHARMYKRAEDETAARLIAAIAERRLAELRSRSGA